MRLASYLDDWLIVNAIKKMLLLDRERLLNLLHKLGFLVNWKKSSLVPSQNITFIGAVFQFQRSIVLPTQERIVKLHLAIHSLIEGHNTDTGPRSAVGNVSGNRCKSDCRSRGREFDHGPVPYFRGD